MSRFYWLIPVMLVVAQAYFTFSSNSQIRYEELAESVRNVFWLQSRVIYDGVSSNIGWYGSLLAIYNLFGFNLHDAKIFRLALFAVSIFALASLLKRYLEGKAWLPLLTIGLSPTLLYYNTIQASHGIDLLYFPIVLFLLIQKRFWIQFIGWVVSMWAWLSYPTFIFYLPSLFLIYIWVLKPSFKQISMCLLAFLIPLSLVFTYIQNRSTLFYDPNIKSGIFRGAGGFDLSLDNVSRNLGGLLADLFAKGSSYHFEVNQGEFSLIFPIVTVVLVLSICLKKRNRWVILALVSMMAVVLVSSLTLDPSGSPGMRRYTPILAAFYTLFVLSWKQLVNFKFQISNFKFLMISIISLLLVHHLIVYPINLRHLKDPSPEQIPLWFSISDTPKKSLDLILEQVKKEDFKIVCMDKEGEPFYCRYAEIYAAVAGSCIWNKLDCKNILGYDFNSGQFIPLNIDLWTNYYFEH